MESTNTNINIEEINYRQKAISWLFHSLKIIFGDESIRRYIILFYNPTITNRNKKYIRTFDAFVEPGKTREDKADEINRFCKDILKKKGVTVFTATNIQQNKFDNETHFQSYIVNNCVKKLIVIDPAYDKTKDGCAGIYMAEVSNEVVIPYFTENGYSVQFICLSSPAQICESDVFCQSWSLYILLQKIQNNEYLTDVSLEIPVEQLDKYDMLLQFYKQVFTDMPELGDNLRAEYEGEILDTRGPTKPTKIEKEAYLRFDPVDLLMKLTKYEMS